MENQNAQFNLLKFIRENLSILGVIIGLIVGWVTVTNEIKNHEQRLAKLETKQEETDKQFAELKNLVIRVQTILEERLPPANSD